jgi:hypothetical protein
MQDYVEYGEWRRVHVVDLRTDRELQYPRKILPGNDV